MGKRRQSRECAIQFLYQIDIAGSDNLQNKLDAFWKEQEVSEDIKEFSNKIINMVLEHKDEIDKQIVSHATNWDITRIAIVDRNILRTAIGELMYMDDIPPIVSINEAVDIAKAYGTNESGKFVNGILDNIRKDSGKER